MSDWSATQYLQFENERTRPARDLLAQVPHANPKTVVDLGCGPGNSTELLKRRWPEARLLGLDSSPSMLEEARKRLPDVHFEQADIATWIPERPLDVIFANAVMQWLPNPVEILVRLLQHLPPGGVLAVQMPDNLGEASHALMRESAAEMPFHDRLTTVARKPLSDVATYYDALAPHAQRIDLWHSIYHHVLADADAIIEWVRGTGLRPYLDALTEPQQAQFLASYRGKLTTAYPPQNDGKVLLHFPRLFIVVQR